MQPIGQKNVFARQGGLPTDRSWLGSWKRLTASLATRR